MSMREFGKVVGDPIAGPLEITPEQRVAFLQTISDNKDTLIGNIAAARAAGIRGTRKQIHDMIEREGLKEEIFEARGRNVEKVKQTLYEIAQDPAHPGVMRAISIFLKAYGGDEFHDISRHEVTGARGGPVHLLAGQFDLDRLPVEQLEELKQILAAAAPDGEHTADD
jgi:hypothetical protein